MPKVKYDVSNIEDQEFKQAPVGLYICKVVDVQVGQSGAGQPMLTVALQPIKDAKGKKLAKKDNYGRIYHRVPLEHWEDTAGWTFRLKELLKAFGLKAKGSVDFEKVLMDEEVQVRVRAGKDLDDEYQANVGKLLPLAEASTSDDEEEDDDEEEEDDADDEEEEDDDDEEEEDDEEEDDTVDLDELERPDLKTFIKDNELDVKVTKKMSDDDVRGAIQEALGGDDDEEEDDEEEEDQDYSDWGLDDLKKELKERGLKQTGKKPQLVKRLEADDASDGDPF